MFAPCLFSVFHAKAQRLGLRVSPPSPLCFPGWQQLGLALAAGGLFLAGYEPWWHGCFLNPPVLETLNLG